MSPNRVIIVDDEALFREVLSRALSGEPGIDVVGIAEDGVSSIELAADLQPDAGDQFRLVIKTIPMRRCNIPASIKHLDIDGDNDLDSERSSQASTMRCVARRLAGTGGRSVKRTLTRKSGPRGSLAGPRGSQHLPACPARHPRINPVRQC